jgi:hypothetical protein
VRNVYLVVTQGNVYRDLIRLGMLRYLLDSAPDIRVLLLTPAWAVPEVLKEVEHERVIVARHDLFSANGWPGRLARIRQRRKSRAAIDALLYIEKRIPAAPAGLPELFSAYPPSLMVSSHPQVPWEWNAIAYASRMGVTTAGIIKSWDNLLQVPVSRTDYLAVWGKANCREALEITRYRENEVTMVGPAAFDRYFTPGVIRPRDEFWRSKGLDPDKPIVLFGTAGAFTGDWDETFMMDLLLQMTEEAEDLREAQFICRLHPITHLEYFWPYREHPRVTLSFGSYVKTLGWCMTPDEVDDMANMLCHADLVITPASTLSLEGPVFNTPTIVTLFSTVRPELHARATETGWLRRHFKPIVENGWLPLARTPQDLLQMMRRALRDRSWGSDQRRALVDEYVTFTDGKSYQRVATFIDDQAKGGNAAVAPSAPAKR